MRYSNLSRSDIIKSTLIAIVACIALLALSFTVEATDAKPVDVNSFLVSQLTALQEQNTKLMLLIEDLRAEIKRLAGTPTKNVEPIQKATIIGKAKLASPRQLDRPPIADEKTASYIEKLEPLFPEALELMEICEELLLSTDSSGLMASMRKQLRDWIDNKPLSVGRQKGTPAREAYPDCPFSQKQLAWVCYILQPDVFENPYDISLLYPNGNPNPSRARLSLADMKKGG